MPHAQSAARKRSSVDFLSGSEYKNVTEIPRKTCCETCAFRAGPGTVRPDDMTPEDVWNDTDFCDDFVCHTKNADGSFPSCAAWHALKAAQREELKRESL